MDNINKIAVSDLAERRGLCNPTQSPLTYNNLAVDARLPPKKCLTLMEEVETSPKRRFLGQSKNKKDLSALLLNPELGEHDYFSIPANSRNQSKQI